MQTTPVADTVTIKITPNDKGNPSGKLADAEVHFVGNSLLGGLKLIGFSVWERRGTGRNVTLGPVALASWVSGHCSPVVSRVGSDDSRCLTASRALARYP